jgi:prevent-host-death family protein
METIGLRELNQNPSKAVARVRAGVTVVVTDRGRPILRMVPEAERPGALHELVASGQATAPVDPGRPELIPDLAPEVDSLANVLVADRRRERGR